MKYLDKKSNLKFIPFNINYDSSAFFGMIFFGYFYCYVGGRCLFVSHEAHKEKHKGHEYLFRLGSYKINNIKIIIRTNLFQVYTHSLKALCVLVFLRELRAKQRDT
jgi:hypothetical protein